MEVFLKFPKIALNLDSYRIKMKLLMMTLLFSVTLNAFAEGPCDVRPGKSIGIKVIEFTTGHVIHSKMPFTESSADALLEEMINLQDMGICEEKITASRCVLKFEKNNKDN